MYGVIYYQTARGDVRSLEFIGKLSTKTQSKVNKQIFILSGEGQKLRRPYADYLRDGIYELRVKFSPNDIRLLYFFFQRSNIIITHGFTKKTDRVPEREIEKALRCKIEFERRYKEE